MNGRLAGALGEMRLAAGWHRRVLAAGLAAAAVAAGIQAATPAGPPLREVLVAARDLAGGATLTGGDLVRRELPADAVPSGALDHEAQFAGQVLAAPVRAGETVTDVRLVGPSLLAAAGDGLVAAPVRLADAGALALLHPGDRVDVLAADTSLTAPGDPGAEPAAGDGSADRVASDVLVLALPGEAGGALAIGGLVVLATTPQTAARLAAAAAGASLSVTVRAAR